MHVGYTTLHRAVPMQQCIQLTIAPSDTNSAAKRASASHASAKVNAAPRADITGRALPHTHIPVTLFNNI